MTTPLVLLGLAILAGAVVWVLSVRQGPSRGASSWEPSKRAPAHAKAPAMASTLSATTAEMASQPADFAQEEDAEHEGDDPPHRFCPEGACARPSSSSSVATSLTTTAGTPLGVADGLSAKTRLLGIAGLIALIVLTSAVIALGVWLLGHALGLQLSHFANG